MASTCLRRRALSSSIKSRWPATAMTKGKGGEIFPVAEPSPARLILFSKQLLRALQIVTALHQSGNLRRRKSCRCVRMKYLDERETFAT